MLQSIKLINRVSLPFQTRSCFIPSNIRVPRGSYVVNGVNYECDRWTNITSKIQRFLQHKNYQRVHHPLSVLQQEIVDFLNQRYKDDKDEPVFKIIKDLEPIVSTIQHFDDVLIPDDHPSRQKPECFYINRNRLFRSHMKAHLVDLLTNGDRNFVTVGDVYHRGIQIHPMNFPVGTEMLGVRTVSQTALPNETTNAKHLIEELKSTWSDLLSHLSGNKLDHRWVETECFTTSPSWNLVANHRGKKMDLLQTGIIRNQILKECEMQNVLSGIFEIKLDLLAMAVFQIPDIRILWSKSTAFIEQFSKGKPAREIDYKHFIKVPSVEKHVSFWLPEGMKAQDFNENDFFDLIWTFGGVNIAMVERFSTYVHPSTQLHGMSYRIIYNNVDFRLAVEEIGKIHHQIGTSAAKYFSMKLR